MVAVRSRVRLGPSWAGGLGVSKRLSSVEEHVEACTAGSTGSRLVPGDSLATTVPSVPAVSPDGGRFLSGALSAASPE